jgi:hypothetical protein
MLAQFSIKRRKTLQYVKHKTPKEKLQEQPYTDQKL